MNTPFKIVYKDKSFTNVNAKLTLINQTFIDLSGLIDEGKIFFLKITHHQINTAINLPTSSPYILLYFTDIEKPKNHLKFDGADYSLGTSGSFIIFTQAKYILLMPSPLKFNLEQVKKLIISKKINE